MVFIYYCPFIFSYLRSINEEFILLCLRKETLVYDSMLFIILLFLCSYCLDYYLELLNLPLFCMHSLFIKLIFFLIPHYKSIRLCQRYWFFYLPYFFVRCCYTFDYKIIIMLQSARIRKSGAIKSNHSGSKDSKDSVKVKQPEKIYQISTGQIKLRQAIQAKFDRSKIKNFRYSRIFQTYEKQKNKNIQSSVDSEDLVQFAPLKQMRFINLFDYHNKNTQKQNQHNKQFLIKFRSFDTSKKSFKIGNQPQSNKSHRKKIHIDTEVGIQKQDLNINYPLNNDRSFISSFQQRKTISGEKKQNSWRQLGFQYHSASKNPYKFHTRAPSQHDQRNIKLHNFRKQTKSPPPPLRNI